MKRIITIIIPCLLAIISCHKQPAPEPASSEGTATAPVITLTSRDLLLYPGRPAELAFTVTGLLPEGELSVDCNPEEVVADLSFNRATGKGILTLYAGEAFHTEASLAITASNGALSSSETVLLEQAYLRAGTIIRPGAAGGVYEVQVSTNILYAATSTASWVSIISREQDAVTLSVEGNTAEAERYAEIILSDTGGTLQDTVKVIQDAAHHELEITSERQALEAIYAALHGEDWSDSENWCTDAPLKTWYGVMTNTFKGEEHVIYLHLQNMGAHGVLPSAIGELKYLRELWIIGETGITGTIPASFGALENLRDLSLSGTSVSGPIPECLSRLGKLEILGLDDNRFEGNLPLFLRDMPALYNFGFSQNCLDGQIDASLTETRWWNTIDTSTGNKIGEENLARGQKEGHALWL